MVFAGMTYDRDRQHRSVGRYAGRHIAALFAFSVLCVALLGGVAFSRRENTTKLWVVRKEGRYGFIDATGRIVIAPRFYWAAPFSDEGIALVFVCGEYGYIDETGKLTIPAKFDDLGQPSEGLVRATISGKQGYVDQTGQLVIPAQFDDAGRFIEGMAPVKVGGKWGYINRRGRIIIAPRFFFAREFSQGRAAVEVEITQTQGESPIVPRQSGSREVQEGKWALINHSGQLVTSEALGDFGFSETGFLPVFFEGLAPVQIHGGGYEFVDDKGKVVIPGPFEYALDFHDGFAAVKLGGEWGYIDRKGKLVLLPRFDDAGYFSDGVAPATINGQWGYINEVGDWAIEPKFAFASQFENGIAYIVFSHEEWGYLRRDGQASWRAPMSEAPGHAPVFGWTEKDKVESCQ